MLVLGYMLHPINYGVGIVLTARTRMYEYQVGGDSCITHAWVAT